MVVLGISGRSSSAAAAVAVDGAPVAAVGEAELSGRPDAGYRLTGGLPPRAAAFGLERAQAAGRDVSLVAIVDERRWTDAEPRDGRRAVANAASAGADAIATAERLSRYAVAYGPPPLMSLNGQRLVRVGAGHAAAALTAAAMPHGEGLVIILDGALPDAGGIFRKRDGHVQYCAPVRGAGHLARATQLVARALGLPPDAATIDALAELGAAEAPEWAEPLQQALRNDAGEGVAFDAAALTRVIERASAHSPGPLTAVDHPHREVQRRRRALAASLIDRVRAIVVEIARGAVRNDQQTASRAAASIAAASAAARTGIHVGFGGSLFVSPRVNTRLAASLAGLPASVTFSPVPENVGLALGAALAISRSSSASANITPLTRLGLGPSFAEDEIKETLENCRIDYVYEPNWPRLLARASQLLSRGKVVAWFQGAMDFGPRSLGGRSILCDPSNRYARHNMNEYLLQRPLDAPLAVSIPQDATADCLDEPLVSPFMLLRGRFRDDRAEHFHAALDASRACAVHTVDKTHTPELHDLLTLHREQANVAGLIHRPLCGLDVPIAATPRAAIQTLFSSAIDAMVIARFLLMKDYWLLRSEL